jgi:hypothetical protein
MAKSIYFGQTVSKKAKWQPWLVPTSRIWNWNLFHQAEPLIGGIQLMLDTQWVVTVSPNNTGDKGSKKIPRVIFELKLKTKSLEKAMFSVK